MDSEKKIIGRCPFCGGYVRKEHYRRNRCGLEPGVLIQLIQTL